MARCSCLNSIVTTHNNNHIEDLVRLIIIMMGDDQCVGLSGNDQWDFAMV